VTGAFGKTGAAVTGMLLLFGKTGAAVLGMMLLLILEP
jgi:hypothetical protein